jgi:hypothetical protein
MNSTLKLAPACCLLAATLLSGCADLKLPVFGGAKPAGAHPRAEGAKAAPGSAPAAAADQLALKEGIDLYNNGDYNAAIKRLGAPEIANGPKATQLEAIKYTAFSYCVTSRQTLCRQQFEKALKLDPNFDLAPGEHGHPLWGPVFTRAKKGK